MTSVTPLRDLKSGNCLVTEQLRIKVTDFGSVSGSIYSAYFQNRTEKSTPLTASIEDGNLTIGVGTPLYMAPEILRGDKYDKSADIFSFGCLLWEIATQRAPDLIEETLGQVKITGPFLGKLLQLWEEGHTLPVEADWSEVWQATVRGCLQVDSSQRPSFQELHHQFKTDPA